MFIFNFRIIKIQIYLQCFVEQMFDTIFYNIIKKLI
jgi:hypothetical protein